VERIVDYISCGSVIIIELEFPVSSTGHCDIMTPSVEIERSEVVFEDKLALACCE
jgi:hypothetical protein